MTDQEFDERLAEFWADLDGPSGEEAVLMLIRAAARLQERIAQARREKEFGE